MNKTPINIANSTVKKYNTRDPFQIAKEKNVILVYAPLVDIRGFYQYFQRQHIICIDQNLPEHQKKFVCAHELGHMLMHKSSNTVYMDTKTFLNTNKFENEANELTTGQLSRLLGYEETMIKLRLKSYQPEKKNEGNDI